MSLGCSPSRTSSLISASPSMLVSLSFLALGSLHVSGNNGGRKRQLMWSSKFRKEKLSLLASGLRKGPDQSHAPWNGVF